MANFKKILPFAAAACVIAAAVLPARFKGGDEKTREEQYLSVVSLGPYVTENLWLLGCGKNITGLTMHDLPERREGKEIIGTLIDPNIEKILSLNPEIVIASKEGNRQEAVEKLRQLGLKTIVLKELYTFRDICDNFLLLGAAMNLSGRASEITAASENKLEEIKKKTAAGKRKKVFFILGFKPLFTMGGKNYINEMIENAGGENIFKDVGQKWFSCSIEEVIRRNPDVIVFIRMEQEAEFFREKIESVAAVKNNMVFGMEPTVIGSPTPESFAGSVENLYNLMRRSVKNEP